MENTESGLPEMSGGAERNDAGPPDRASSLAYLGHRIRRHLEWARKEGVGRLIEEDQLNPIDRISKRGRKVFWRLSHGSTVAVPVFVVGVQRSGTNMLIRALDKSPAVKVYNENNKLAFDRFVLRENARVERIVRRCHYEGVIFKPLIDSHRIDQILDELETERSPRALWVFRRAVPRARSAVSKFGDTNLTVLTAIARGAGGGLWQAQKLSPESLELIRGIGVQDLTPLSAAALFWYVRNALYFDLGLDTRDDVMLVSYEQLVAAPDRVVRGVCRYAGLTFSPDLVADIDSRSSTRKEPEIDGRVAELCRDMEARLTRAADMQLQALS